jgi:hypothetical protein
MVSMKIAISHPPQTPCVAFAGASRIASGTLATVALKAKEALDRDSALPVLIFDDRTSETVEVDFRGTLTDLSRRMTDLGKPAPEPPRGVGRPKLGVVGREVTLLPRQWDWLGTQPGGASVTLRRLVEEARRSSQGRDAKRQAQNAAYRFMTVMAGNEAGFEEANRALWSGDREKFNRETRLWPPDVREHARKLAEGAFSFC